MVLKDLLDFKNQHIVDELYKRMKKDGDEELEAVYQEVSQQNKTALQTTQYHYRNIMKKVLSFIDLIMMILFFVLFLVCGSFILGTLIGYFHMAFVEFLAGPYDFVCGVGVWLLEHVFHASFPMMETEVAYSQNAVSALPVYVLGMTFLLIVFFLGLYIYSLFKKPVPKKELKFSLAESYYYLQANEDDDFAYIKSNFERKIQKHRNKEFYERYYKAYVDIFYGHQEVQGTIKDLTKKQQVKLCFFTFTNTVKNIFGSFSKPIYFSIAFMIVYYRYFMKRSFLTLEFYLSIFPGGENVFGFIKQCYNIVIKTPFSHLLECFDLEFSMVMSFCIVMIFIWFIKDIATRKIRESKRQYHRRLNFYLKQNQGLYEEKRKYAKAYHYGVEFTIFVAFLGACLMIQHLNANFESHEFALENKAIRESVIKKISPYVDQQKCLLSTSQDIYLAHYIFEDQLYEDLAHSHIKQSYIKVYTFHTEEEALDAISACSIFSESNSMIEVSRQSDKLFKYKGKIGYFYSEDGFVIKDRTSVIVMKNNDRLHDKLFDDEMSCLSQPLTKKEIRKIMKDMGYAV